MDTSFKPHNQNKSLSLFHPLKCTLCLLPVFLILLLLHLQSSPFHYSSSSSFFRQSQVIESMRAKLRESVTFLPLKDLRFADNAEEGHTWFMSSLNATVEKNEPEYLLFPSEESRGRLLCLKGRDTSDGTKNSYALAWPDTLPDSSHLMEGLTFVSNTYYNHENLWHAMGATVPFIRWSMKNGCVMPTRWILFHWGELKFKMGSWIQKVIEASFQDVNVEKFEEGDGPHCFEKAVVMRNDLGSMGQESKLEVFDLLRCKARDFCRLKPAGRGKEVSDRGEPVIRLTLLTRRGSRSFKNVSIIKDAISKVCAEVEGCIFEMVQSEDLSFCDQVKKMTNTDIVASPHGAQLTNMIFMDRGSSVMEFFPKGWLEYAGPGQYAHHWLANMSGMKHQGAWWDPIGKACPDPNDHLQCFLFHKDGKIGHNETFFAEWTRKVLHQVKTSKLEQASKELGSEKSICACY